MEINKSGIIDPVTVQIIACTSLEDADLHYSNNAFGPSGFVNIIFRMRSFNLIVALKANTVEY